MLKKYFFVPSNKEKFISKALNLEADYLVFDLEDSVTKVEINDCLNNLSKISIQSNYYVRPNLYSVDDNQIDTEQFYKLIELGFRRFLIPKFAELDVISELDKMLRVLPDYHYDEFEFILLVEHPKGLLNLSKALESGLINIKAVGFGSHDYCKEMRMRHELENLYFSRQIIVNTAKAYGKVALDIVSVDLSDDDKFIDEVYNGFSMGFDGKFLIHPKQLDLMDEVKYYSDDEIKEAEEVYDQIMKIKNQELSIVKVNGKVYEKPHINNIIDIIQWRNSYGSKFNG